MSNKMNLKSGLEKFEINFQDRGTKAEIEFNPCDPDLMKRLFEAKNIIYNKSKEIKNYKLDENGILNADSYIDFVNEINKSIYDALDYAFGNKISDTLFQYCSPLSIVDGQYFILYFLDRLLPIIEKNITDKHKTANKNINKHIAKYVKNQ